MSDGFPLLNATDSFEFLSIHTKSSFDFISILSFITVDKSLTRFSIFFEYANSTKLIMIIFKNGFIPVAKYF